jgi:allantoate deiminase
MSTFSQYAKQVYQRCDDLAQFSQHPDHMDRRYLTPEHKKANQQVAIWMQEAGMETWLDEAGNQWGAYSSAAADAPTLMIGSHLDTVPNGGKYDGILGVLLPLGIIQYFHDNDITLPFHLELVGFGDEEGTRFGATLLGSRAVAGTWQESWATLTDENGIGLAKAMRDFDLDINQVCNSVRDNQKVSAFIEMHIEQGPVLEASHLPVGVVSGIAGAKRFNVQLKGQAGHAGTVPMDMRKDALAAAAQMILAIEAIAIEHLVVATVGSLVCLSGAVNVISGHTQFSLDIRSENDQLRDAALKQIEVTLSNIAHNRKVELTLEQTHHANAVLCDKGLQQQLSKAIEATDIEAKTLTSGAGHDTMAMSNICPVAMLFMRCEKGISHHPSEAVTIPDIAITMNVLKVFLLEYQA